MLFIGIVMSVKEDNVRKVFRIVVIIYGIDKYLLKIS